MNFSRRVFIRKISVIFVFPLEQGRIGPPVVVLAPPRGSRPASGGTGARLSVRVSGSVRRGGPLALPDAEISRLSVTLVFLGFTFELWQYNILGTCQEAEGGSVRLNRHHNNHQIENPAESSLQIPGLFDTVLFART